MKQVFKVVTNKGEIKEIAIETIHVKGEVLPKMTRELIRLLFFSGFEERDIANMLRFYNTIGDKDVAFEDGKKNFKIRLQRWLHGHNTGFIDYTLQLRTLYKDLIEDLATEKELSKTNSEVIIINQQQVAAVS